MNAVECDRKTDEDGRTIVVTRALQMSEFHYVERPPDEIVDAKRDLLVTFTTQYGDETKRRIEELVRGGMDLDHATWKACEE